MVIHQSNAIQINKKVFMKRFLNFIGIRKVCRQYLFPVVFVIFLINLNIKSFTAAHAEIPERPPENSGNTRNYLRTVKYAEVPLDETTLRKREIEEFRFHLTKVCDRVQEIINKDDFPPYFGRDNEEEAQRILDYIRQILLLNDDQFAKMYPILFSQISQLMERGKN